MSRLRLVSALASLGNLRLGAAARWPTWTAALPAVLIAAGAWMYFAVPAAEYVLGGRDPGVYMNEGIQIAQTAIAGHDRPRRGGSAGVGARSVFSVTTPIRITTAFASWDFICAIPTLAR